MPFRPSRPFRDLMGIFQKRCRARRVRILLSLIGVDVPVQISKWQIKECLNLLILTQFDSDGGHTNWKELKSETAEAYSFDEDREKSEYEYIGKHQRFSSNPQKDGVSLKLHELWEYYRELLYFLVLEDVKVQL